MAYTSYSGTRKPKAALYIRVSTLYQIDKDSLPFQKQELTNLAKYVLNIEDYEIFEDAGYSGKNTDRPAYQRMMSKVRKGEFTHLCVWKIDRISRNLLDFAAMYDELKKYHVTFVSKNEQFDTSSAMGEAMLKIILVFAELERKLTSERVTGIMLDRATKGLWNGARMPVGYKWNDEKKFPEPDPDEVKIVRLIFDMYEECKSSLQISRYLNNNGVKSKRGGQWTSKLVHDIIRNPFYIGTYRYNLRASGRGPLKSEDEWIIRENNHEGIIEKAQFERCNSIMDTNGVNRDTSELRGTKYVHTFSGHMICARCGASMIASKDRARANSWRPSMYRCSSRSRMMNCDNSKNVNEAYIGPFIFNYIANLARVQKNFKSIMNTEKLQAELLKGDIFNTVGGIKPDGLSLTLQALLYNQPKNGAYIPDIGFMEASSAPNDNSRIDILSSEIEKSKNAITRLTDVYLYDPESMTKEEYSSKRKELAKKIEDMEKQLAGLLEAGEDKEMTDISFIKKASAFLMTRRLVSKSFVDYIQMAQELDNEILKDFIDQVIDQIIIDDGRVQSITFVNGLKHEFYYSRPAELPVCKKCGGRIGSTCGCRTRSFSYGGVNYRRIKVGDSRDALYGKKNPVCPDCSAQDGRWHHWLCKIEICPICDKPLYECEHGEHGKKD